MSESVFLREKSYYKRDINPIRQWVEQSAFYLHKMTGDSLEVCAKWISEHIGDKMVAPNATDPVVHHYYRDENKDRHRTATKLSSYIRQIVSNGFIMAPTGTAYLRPEQEASFLVEFVEDNVAKRSKAKKEMFVAKGKGDKELAAKKNNTQNNMKLYNNSLSGTFGTVASVLFNPTGHNTLTSTIRSVSSFSNASNERVLSGNRHYWSKDVALNNLISITSDADSLEIEAVVNKYGLVYPTAQDTMDCVRRSSDMYWRDLKGWDELQRYIVTLTPQERAAFVYTGDLYHLKKLNEGFVRQMLTELSAQVIGQVEDALDKIYKIPEEIVNYGHQICFAEMRGKGKRYEEIDQDGNLGTLILTCYNVMQVLEKYRDFFKCMFLTRSIPASTAYIRGMVRHNVTLSDTDSTMFAVDDYVGWYFGRIRFTPQAYAVAGAVVFITSQTVAHILAVFSANVGVTPSKLHGLAMKPEYTFPVFGLTSVAKHYFTAKVIQEGQVYNEPEMEIKGVHLKNSSSPPDIIETASETMREIINTIMRGELISLLDFLTKCADLERKITNSLLAGEIHYYRKSKVKDAKAYTTDELKSPYVHHLFWEIVFKDKYGSIAPPPYSVIKIPTNMATPTAVNRWLASIPDREVARKLVEWMTLSGKNKLPTIYLPALHVSAYGLPNEVKSVIDTKRIVLDLMNVFRMISETLGFFLKPEMTFCEMGY